MHCVLAIKRTILIEFKLTSNILTILVCGIILSFAFRTLQSNNFYSTFFLATHIYAPVFIFFSSSSPRAGSNRRPQPYHGCALPTELQGRNRLVIFNTMRSMNILNLRFCVNKNSNKFNKNSSFFYICMIVYLKLAIRRGFYEYRYAYRWNSRLLR